ncbi:MAG: hypothetical protein AAFV53_01215 [Myxococcota bacterium]
MSVLLWGCLPGSVDRILADPSTGIDDDGSLYDVQLVGEIGGYQTRTRSGWGSASAWTDGDTGETGFTIDMRGRGVVMSRVTVHGLDFSSLHLEEVLDLNGLVYGMTYTYSDGLGCGGHVEDEWDIDILHTGGALTVIDQDEETTTLHVDLDFGISWTRAALVLPRTLPMRQ